MNCAASRRCALSMLCLALWLPSLMAQTATPSPVPTATPIPGSTATPLPSSSASPVPGASTSPIPLELQPIPYKADEFPVWTYDLRRGEIITVGSFPIAYLVSSLCFDIGRYLVKLANNDPSYSYYVPFSTNKRENTTAEYTGVIIAAIGVSVVVAVIDFIIGQSEAAERDRVARQKKADAANLESNIHEPEPPPPDPATEPSTTGTIIDPRQEVP